MIYFSIGWCPHQPKCFKFPSVEGIKGWFADKLSESFELSESWETIFLNTTRHKIWVAIKTNTFKIP